MARTGLRADTSTASATSHLGTTVGDTRGARIIALSTCAVFSDASLVRTFWHTDPTGIDSGIQGHLYARPGDVLIVRIPNGAAPAIEMLSRCLDENAEIWASATGLRLATSRSRVVLTVDQETADHATELPTSMSWHVGTLAEAAAAQHLAGHGSLLAFVLDEPTVAALAVRDAGLLRQARATTLLMDKNRAMELLGRAGIPMARTLGLTKEGWRARRVKDALPGGRYVFKPAGGAAGIGVHFDAGRGSSARDIDRHLRMLAGTGRLPHRFQVQEFLDGTPHGVSAFLPGDGTAHVLEAHRQVVDAAGRCVGARWSPDIEAAQVEPAQAICDRLADFGDLHLAGLICLDLIAGRVIEVNPRLTACSPIAHLLHHEAQIVAHRGNGFRIRQIDVHTALSVPAACLQDGRLRTLIALVEAEFGVLALPQGLNPFGPCRFVFVNDDPSGTAQQFFLRQVDRLAGPVVR